MDDNFSQQAELYARYRPVYPASMYEFIFSHLIRKRLAWDCGTGSGQVASCLAEHFEKVYASDISRQQLSYAPQKDNVEYFNTPAEDSGFSRDSFDLITVAQAIHWFDFERFYREVRRTAAPKGLLAVIGYGFIRVDRHINPVINQFYRAMFSSYFSKNRSYLDQQYKTIPFPFDEIPAPSFEIELEWSLNELKGYFHSWSSVQKFKIIKGYNPVDDIMKKLAPMWTESEIRKVTFPVFLRLGEVKK